MLFEIFKCQRFKRGKMRKKTFLCVIAVLMFAASCAHYDSFPEGLSEGLDEPEALKALIDEGKTGSDGRYRIIDVRPKEAYEEGHIPTAMNLPNGIIKKDTDTPPKDALIIVYCETGGRAEMAARRMADAGYEHIYNWGGYGKWPAESE